ncbi:MAG TPA: thiamine ABC transporter substrate-binding protein [Euryarchaeota archaeon]|nr:MAG: thiamine ABC transporter substrate-binding protein [Thermoplasmata archaeon]HHD15949.1 thiamine ABC transporter substrate-binding protein [Euryarchaeota archaeon]
MILRMRKERIGALSRGTMVSLTVLAFVLVMTIGGAIYILERTGEDEGDLVIYAYESFQSYGLGPAVIPEFEKMYGVKVTVETPGDVGTVLAKINLEKGDPGADVVIGVDNSMLHRAVEMDLLSPYVPTNIDRLDPTMSFDPGHHIVPFDYGYIAIICSREMMEERDLPYPASVLDLADPVYRGQLLLLDPAQSSTGSSFMIWAAQVAGDNYSAFFDDLAGNAEGKVFGSWDAMYNMWGDGEAPIAISYGLDTAYEMMWYGTNDTVTIVPPEEGYRQIEGAGLVKGARHRELAEKFLDFILTDEFQSEVYNNYMLPVVPSVEVNEYFLQYGASADRHVEPTVDEVSAHYDDWMAAWREAFFG